MLSLFPQILFLAPASVTLLRVCAGCVFLYLAYRHSSAHRALSEELSAVISGAGTVAGIYAVIEYVIAILLIVGAYTQPAALFGALLAGKSLLIRKKLRELKPLSELAYFLLGIICISIVFSGAGAFAFDLPL